MNAKVLLREYPQPEIDLREIARYLGCRSPDSASKALLEEALSEAQPLMEYKVCYAIEPIKLSGDECNFSGFSFRSRNLADNLAGCKKAVLFAATVGIGLDRLILKYSKTAVSKAVMLQAIGAERIEALCDMFITDIGESLSAELKPRFSPGYGDLQLSAQSDIIALLNCQRLIGVTLNSSLLMSPSKSVTAFAGIK